MGNELSEKTRFRKTYGKTNIGIFYLAVGSFLTGLFSLGVDQDRRLSNLRDSPYQPIHFAKQAYRESESTLVKMAEITSKENVLVNRQKELVNLASNNYQTILTENPDLARGYKELMDTPTKMEKFGEGSIYFAGYSVLGLASSLAVFPLVYAIDIGVRKRRKEKETKTTGGLEI
jgi:hypothetical protein